RRWRGSSPPPLPRAIRRRGPTSRAGCATRGTGGRSTGSNTLRREPRSVLVAPAACPRRALRPRAARPVPDGPRARPRDGRPPPGGVGPQRARREDAARALLHGGPAPLAGIVGPPLPEPGGHRGGVRQER